MPDRSRIPEIKEVGNLTVPRPEVWHLSNGIPVYETSLGTQEIVKLELVFFAGRPFEHKKLVSRATPALMKEGTRSFTSAEIAETLDYYGGTLSMQVGMDTANVLLYSLSKHFGRLLPLLSEILHTPTFPQKELDAFIQRNQQRLQVELTKNDVVAYRVFTELLYGEQHPYGYNSYPDTYAALVRNDLIRHFEAHFTTGNCMIFLSGKIDRQIRLLLDEFLGKQMLQGEKKQAMLPAVTSRPENRVVPHTDKVQTALRIGCRLFNRSHPDFNAMYVLNTILGGYFGSRLMTNIREEKGYTYNIYSNHDSMLYGGYFYVASEVGNEFVSETLNQIYLEMEKLMEEPVGAAEMAMVRNYLLGNLLTNLDGPFNISEVIKTYMTEGLPVHAFEEMAAVIANISPEDLQAIARKYFQRKEMWEVIV